MRTAAFAQAVEPRPRAREHETVREHEPGGTAQDHRAQLGHAVRQQPTPEIDAEAARRVERDERAEHEPVVEQQQQRR
jgi:hypothetical protein